MLNRPLHSPANDVEETLGSALTRWARDPMLVAMTSRSGAILLVLDEDGTRILHASEDAAALRAAIAYPDGRIFASLGLREQVERLRALSGSPRLVRLRFDARGLASPSLCKIALAALGDGRKALLVAPLDAPRFARLPPERVPNLPRASDAPASAAADPSAVGFSAMRIVWRSDRDGVLTKVGAAHADLVAGLEGRSWQALCAQARTIESETLLAALHENRTFRALSLVLRLRPSGRKVEIELSGAPSGRGTVPTGFSGFGIVRDRGAKGLDGNPSADPFAPLAAETSAHGSSAPSLLEPNSEPRDLSAEEKAAFLEIAHTLSHEPADDGSSDEQQPAGRRLGDLTTPSVLADRSPPPATFAEALERLPCALLVHRDNAILFANRAFLEIGGFSDVEILRRSIDETGLSTAGATLAGDLLSFPSEAGHSIALQIERSRLDWDGSDAELIVARPPPPARTKEPAPPASTREREALAVLDSLDDGIVTLDEAGRIVALNLTAEAIFAGDRETMAGQPFADLFEPAARAVVDAGLRDAVATGACEPRDVVAGAQGAVARQWHLSIMRVTSEAPLFRASLREPVTLQQAVDEEDGEQRRLELAARSKLDFFAKSAQQIRTPLNGIMSLTDAMLAEQFGPLGSEQYRDYLFDIHASGGRAVGLLNDLVELAEIEAGRIDLAFADLPLNDLVARCIAQMQPQATRDRIVFRTSLSPDLTTLLADERSMRQATLNAIAHAIRFTEPGGQIIVSTTLAERGEIALRVRDTGAGMSPAEVEQALEPFRLPMPGLTNDNAPGLGLTLAKALVEANRGRFRLSSRKDEGTLVEMVFSPGALSA